VENLQVILPYEDIEEVRYKLGSEEISCCCFVKQGHHLEVPSTSREVLKTKESLGS